MQVALIFRSWHHNDHEIFSGNHIRDDRNLDRLQRVQVGGFAIDERQFYSGPIVDSDKPRIDPGEANLPTHPGGSS